MEAIETTVKSIDRIVGELKVGIDREQNARLLFERYHHAVAYFFTRRGFPEEERRDLTQETFLNVYKNIDRFREAARFETWLFEIAANIYRNALRSQTAHKREGQEVSLESIDEESPSKPEIRLIAPDSLFGRPLDNVLDRERSRVLRETLAELPAQMQRCVVLRLDRDLSYREIAELMQISVETVKVQLHRARQRLRPRLAERLGKPGSDHLKGAL